MPRPDSDASRLAIVVAVWKLIADDGIEGVTFRRVAERADVSVGRIQHHFGTREVLVRAGCAAMIELAHDQYQQLSDDPLTRLRYLLVHALPDSPETRFGASVWHAYLAKAVDDPEIGRLLAETKRGTEDEYVALIEKLHPQASGEENRDNARRLLALADGLTVRVLVGDLSGAEARALLEEELTRLA